MFNINNIPLDDEKVYKSIYHQGNTFGVFQVDSAIGTRTCKKFQPSNISEISVVISIVRPGVSKAFVGDKSMTNIIIDRKHGIEQVEYLHPSLEPILKDTYGIIVYQEQAIRIAQDIAGFNGNEADTLRKGIGKKDTKIISELEITFINGCKATNIVNEEIAQLLFDNIRASQRYSFNLSHAVSYAIISYQTAYLKYYYPIIFYCTCLRMSRDKQHSQEFQAETVIDGRTNHIDFAIPDIRDKEIQSYIKKEKYVGFGLENIRGIGESAQNSILDIIKETELEIGKHIEDFTWTDFLFLISGKISSTVIEGLIFCGALDYLGVPRQQMFFEFEKTQMLTKGEKSWIINKQKDYPFPSLYEALIAVSPKKKAGGGCHTDKKTEFILGLAQSVNQPSLSIKDNPRFIAMMEEKYLGVSITCSVTDGTMEADMANYTCEDINHGRGSINISFVAKITRCKEFQTKKGDNAGKYMAFIDLHDKTAALKESVVIFPELWEKHRNKFDPKSSYYFIGSRSKKNSIIIENLQKIS